MLRFVVTTGLGLTLSLGLVSAQSASSTSDLLKDPAVKAALDAAKASEAQTIEDQIRFCEIPAPSFKEEVRGQELKRVFQQLGLQNVRVDKVGNVLGDYPGAARASASRAGGASRHRVSRRHRRQGEARRGACCADPASATTAAASRCSSRSFAR